MITIVLELYEQEKLEKYLTCKLLGAKPAKELVASNYVLKPNMLQKFAQ